MCAISVAVNAFRVASLALTVGVVFGFPQWWQTILYSADALAGLFMLFVIQHTSNQQTGPILFKPDELIHTSSDARNQVIDAVDAAARRSPLDQLRCVEIRTVVGPSSAMGNKTPTKDAALRQRKSLNRREYVVKPVRSCVAGRLVEVLDLPDEQVGVPGQ